jgi:hypothetical protein
MGCTLHTEGSPYNLVVVCRGGRSLVESLVKEFPGLDPSQFIGFYCLRNWGVMNDKVVTEQVYVHDKVCAVRCRKCDFPSW